MKYRNIGWHQKRDLINDASSDVEKTMEEEGVTPNGETSDSEEDSEKEEQK